DLIEQGVTLSRTDEKLVEMSNGCICCTLREDLLIEIRKLAEEGRFDYLLIESTGISEPLPVAETFTFEDEQGKSLGSVARLDTMVTVVDSLNFLADYEAGKLLKDRGLQANENDERTLSDLLVEQVEFADVIILNKTDLVSAEQIKLLYTIIKNLNPDAKIVESQFGKINLKEILNTGRFDFHKASQAPKWLKEIRGQHTPETEEYGISSFVFQESRPFDPHRLHSLFSKKWAGVIRAKGFFWISSRKDLAWEFSQAGGMRRWTTIGTWWASKKSEEWPKEPERQIEIKKDWHPRFGDRKQKIVVIGKKEHFGAIKKALRTALATDTEIETVIKDDPFTQ
ncbi:MAG: GTP-binding protein, partial [Proteobacteria bacterium]|nr:GTP-binding protein [Pseudomonadota bacterium]